MCIFHKLVLDVPSILFHLFFCVCVLTLNITVLKIHKLGKGALMA